VPRIARSGAQVAVDSASPSADARTTRNDPGRGAAGIGSGRVATRTGGRAYFAAGAGAGFVPQGGVLMQSLQQPERAAARTSARRRDRGRRRRFMVIDP